MKKKASQIIGIVCKIWLSIETEVPKRDYFYKHNEVLKIVALHPRDMHAKTALVDPREAI